MIGPVENVNFDHALSEVKKHIRLNEDEDNARTRVLMFNVSYLQFCKKRGWKFDKDAQKAAFKHIWSILQPPVLKERIESSLKLEKRTSSATIRSS